MYSTTMVQRTGEIITAELHESGLVLRSSLPSRDSIQISIIDLYDLIEQCKEAKNQE